MQYNTVNNGPGRSGESENWDGEVHSKRSRKIWSGLMVSIGIMLMPLAQAASLEQQRTWYEQAQEALADKEMTTYQNLRNKLNSYPLAPYLDYRAFAQSLSQKTPKQVNAFLAKYKQLPFGGTIKERYLTHLANTQRWQDFLALQPQPPRGQVLRCYYYYAKSEQGDKAAAWKGAKSLWLTGKSTQSACDPLLNQWQQAGLRTNALILERMLLVYSEGNRSRLVYLNKQLTGKKQQAGKDVLALFDKPEGVADFAKRSKVTPFNQQLTQLAYKKLVRGDVNEAIAQYPRTVAGQHFDVTEQQALADYTASRLMATDDAALQQWRDNALAKTRSVSLLERRIRQAMREDEWQAVATWLARLPESAKQTNRWQFWQARLNTMAGKKAQATEGYTALLGQRNFYSAAAATILGKPIVYDIKTAEQDNKITAQYTQTLVRIRELIALDKLRAANREWQYLLKGMNNEEIIAMATYAAANRWHHLAVQATIAGKLWDYIELRFPIAHQWWFDFFSKQRDLPATTMMALARQESALNAEAMSPVGARGLMQLMPATAKETAKQLGRNYKGKDSLLDPGVNIRLGSGYLKMMLERYDNNRIFAFAAYNAGPRRVDSWRKGTDGRLDVYAFIEAIPFNETRGYVQNVLMFEVYYGGLTDQSIPLLQKNELKAKY